ncbi:MAG TPA: GNAT family N-acetyltransferase [Candidatus Angelobacter sp.]|nr:GNAT family N-acetyltransferase [Candidatus Angelobacter sp.]
MCLIRPAVSSDLAALAKMCHLLWPDGPVEEHTRELTAFFSGNARGSLPLTYFVADDPNHGPIAFIQVGLRSHAESCDPARPVGYVEGWFVQPEFRRQGIAAQLLEEAERWARSQGCREMASDSWIDNLVSESAHLALGFEIVDRCTHYRKQL